MGRVRFRHEQLPSVRRPHIEFASLRRPRQLARRALIDRIQHDSTIPIEPGEGASVRGNRSNVGRAFWRQGTRRAVSLRRYGEHARLLSPHAADHEQPTAIGKPRAAAKVLDIPDRPRARLAWTRRIEHQLERWALRRHPGEYPASVRRDRHRTAVSQADGCSAVDRSEVNRWFATINGFGEQHLFTVGRHLGSCRVAKPREVTLPSSSFGHGSEAATEIGQDDQELSVGGNVLQMPPDWFRIGGDQTRASTETHGAQRPVGVPDFVPVWRPDEGVRRRAARDRREDLLPTGQIDCANLAFRDSQRRDGGIGEVRRLDKRDSIAAWGKPGRIDERRGVQRATDWIFELPLIP